MPVLIAAQKADVDIVRAVASRLRAAGGEVRCYLDDDDYELREMGCKIAVGLLDDAYNLSGALTNVHTFLALMPDALTWPDPVFVEQVGSAWASAAAEADIEQTILSVSCLEDAFRSVSALFQQSCEPLAVILTRLVVGPERPLKKGMGSTVDAVDIEQLSEVLAAADDREVLSGRWGLDGWPIEVEGSPGLPDARNFVPDNSAAEEFSGTRIKPTATGEIPLSANE